MRHLHSTHRQSENRHSGPILSATMLPKSMHSSALPGELAGTAYARRAGGARHAHSLCIHDTPKPQNNQCTAATGPGGLGGLDPARLPPQARPGVPISEPAELQRSLQVCLALSACSMLGGALGASFQIHTLSTNPGAGGACRRAVSPLLRFSADHVDSAVV